MVGQASARPLLGRNAAVTGGARGIGRAIAMELGRQGANVIITYRREEHLASAVAGDIRSLGVSCNAVKVDVRNQEELDQKIEEWTLTLDKYEVAEMCQAAGVPAAPVQSSEDRVERDPQMKARGHFSSVLDHPVLGPKRHQSAPFTLSNAYVGVNRASPMLGQDTVKVMERVLGMTREEVKEGYKDGTFWPEDLGYYPQLEEAMNELG